LADFLVVMDGNGWYLPEQSLVDSKVKFKEVWRFSPGFSFRRRRFAEKLEMRVREFELASSPAHGPGSIDHGITPHFGMCDDAFVDVERGCEMKKKLQET
jgi:hypothetical protein